NNQRSVLKNAGTYGWELAGFDGVPQNSMLNFGHWRKAPLHVAIASRLLW
ncbi:MAG: hypothetical protein AWT59_3442, partial [Candidatus Gallionella acididurans]